MTVERQQPVAESRLLHSHCNGSSPVHGALSAQLAMLSGTVNITPDSTWLIAQQHALEQQWVQFL